MSLPRIAIIGTGITALSIGHYLPLVNPLVEITFFDKGQKAGGRVATRRSRNNPELLFDHGAPFLWEDNVKGDFRKVMDELGVVRQVNINIVKAQNLKGQNAGEIASKKVLVGKNGLDSVPEGILKSIKNVKGAHFEHRVVQITQTKQNSLQLSFQQLPNTSLKDTPSFHQIFCCIPFPQAKSIKQQLVSFEPYNQVKSSYNAHWIVLLSVKKGELFGEYKDADVIEFKNQQSPVKYAVKQNKKFEKLNGSQVDNWAVYFSQKWTDTNLNLTKDQVQQKFLTQILPQYSTTTQPHFITVHRWLYSSPKTNQVIKSPIVSSDKRLVFAGDWVGSRQSVGECWQLGREIVEEMYGSVGSKGKL